MTKVEKPKHRGEARAKRRDFPAWVEQECAEPATRAALRRGLRRSIDDVPQMHRWIAAWLPANCSNNEQRVYYSVAAMIADQPRFELPANAGNDDEEIETSSVGDAATATESTSQQTPGAGTPTDSGQPHKHGESLGTAYARAVINVPGADGKIRSQTAGHRLNTLTRQSTEGLHRYLPATVRHLRQAEVPVDWARLMDDLIAWPLYRGRIARRWLQDYYQLLNDAAEHDASTEDLEEAHSLGGEPT